ncbi:MAG: ClbS/DfsB family four-helix bundle protein [Chloroflexota bacterium]|nr:ClbS/DfsB family four-helix bundle protein [Chloroflexota bacterium]
METPTTKADLLALIGQERAAWEELLAEVGEERLTQPDLAGGWTFKDVAAHLTAWRQRAVVRLQAVQRGETPPPPPWAGVPADDDSVNDWIYQTNRARPAADVLRDSRESLAHLEAAVAVLPEADLFDRQRFPWMGDTTLAESIMGNSCDHFFSDHAPVLRAWVSRQAA